MKRYFILTDAQHAELLEGVHSFEWHGITLEDAGAGHHAVAVIDPHGQPPADWEQLPHLLSRKTLAAHGKGHHEKLAHLGARPEHSTYDVAELLGQRHALMAP